MKISVVVATFNRADRIERFLESVQGWTVPASIDWNVFVVDNNSSDATPDVVESCRQRLPERIFYIHEPRQGKSIALNAAVARADGDVLAFTDDDCIPSDDWLASIAREFEANPALGVVGGRVELFDPRDSPITIRTSRTRAAADVTTDFFYFIVGCNMAMRRDVFDAVGGLDPRLGPGGAYVADDVDLLYRIFRIGCRMEYVPDILVFHNHGRRTGSAVDSLSRTYSRGRGAFYAKHILAGDGYVLRLAYWQTIWILRTAAAEIRAGRSISQQTAALWHMLDGAAHLPFLSVS